MKYTYVASPLGAATYAGIQENIRRATSYCKWIWRSRHSIPVAPHIYFPCFLDDMDAADREVGTDEGLKLLALCDEMCVFAEDYAHASPGMRAEIKLAETLGIPVEYIKLEDEELSKADAEERVLTLLCKVGDTVYANIGYDKCHVGMTSGEKIRALRKSQKMTQKDLGDKVGVSQSAIGQFETSKNSPKIVTLKNIAKALNVSVIDLIED